MGGYDAFPCLIDLLKVAVEAGRGTEVAGICAFIEEVALSGKRDPDLASLVRIELGEKLGWMEHEERLAPHLGEETKRICGYVPGLATQRLESRREREVLTLGQRLLRMLRREE